VDISGYSPAIDPQTVSIASLAGLSPPIKTAIRYTYDTANYDRILTVSDERSTPFQTTSFAYTVESGGEVITATLPWGSVVAKRNPDGTVREYTDANGKTTLFNYYPVTPENIAAGSAGQLQKITGPDGVSVSFTLYDKNGNPTGATLIDSNAVDRVVTSLEHDAMNRLKTLTGIASGLPANITNFDYDLAGNLKSLVDAENHETTYEYTYDRQLKKISNVVNGLPVETVFEYSGSGCATCGGGVDKLTAVKDPNQVKNGLPGTVYQYDAAGRLEYETDPIGKKFRYTYYDNGLSGRNTTPPPRRRSWSPTPTTIAVSWKTSSSPTVLTRTSATSRTANWRPPGIRTSLIPSATMTMAGSKA
jgi:YD repeat-containing protein